MSTPPAPPAPGDLGEAPHEPARHGRVGPTPPDGADQGENTAGPAGAGEPSPSGEPSPYVVHGISRALLVDDRERPRALAAGELRRVLPHVKLEVASSRDEAVHLLDRFAAKTASSQDDEGQGDQGQGDQATDGSSLPFLFAVLRDGMAWGEGMALPHVIRDRLPDVPLILTCDPEWDEAPADAQDPARAGRVVRREGLEEAIPIVGDNVAAIAAAAEACLKLDRLTAEQRQLRIERDRLAAERDRAAEERRAVEKKVDSLLRASVKSNEAEAGDRRRLALVLHEDMLQLLVAARMFLACAQDPAQPEPEGGPLGEIDSLLVRSVQLCKDLTGLWSPLVLYEAGLVAALRWLGDTTGAAPADGPADDAASDTGLDEAAGPAGPIPGSLAVEVDCDDDAEPGTQDGRTMLYQAAVELLTNVARHAGVDQARLTLRRVRPGPGLPDLLNLTVSDAGRGFDAAPEPTDATADAPAPPIGAPPIDAPPIDAPSGGAKAARVEVGGRRWRRTRRPIGSACSAWRSGSVSRAGAWRSKASPVRGRRSAWSAPPTSAASPSAPCSPTPTPRRLRCRPPPTRPPPNRLRRTRRKPPPRRSACCWRTITASFACRCPVCWDGRRGWRSSARPSTARTPCRKPASCGRTWC